MRGVRLAPQGEGVRHGVESAVAKRLAARQAPQAQNAATGGAEAGDGDACVVRATRLETAAFAQKRTQQAFINGKQGKNQAGQERATRSAFMMRGAQQFLRPHDVASQCTRTPHVTGSTTWQYWGKSPRFKWLLLGVT